MKLINNTKISDENLTAVLMAAARSLGKRIRTERVVVQVNPAINRYSGGCAYECTAVRWMKGSDRWIKTDGGAFRISIYYMKSIALAVAQAFFDTARHEWGHIHDFQRGGRATMDFSRINRAGRRPAHRFRPEEKRVADYITEAEQKGIKKDCYAEAILNLAIELENMMP